MDVLIFGLATWRISSLLVREDGPLYVFWYIRKLSGIQHDENGEVFMIPSNFLAQVLSCVWCASLWVALGWIVFFLVLPDWALIIATMLSFSTLSIIIDKHLTP